MNLVSEFILMQYLVTIESWWKLLSFHWSTWVTYSLHVVCDQYALNLSDLYPLLNSKFILIPNTKLIQPCSTYIIHHIIDLLQEAKASQVLSVYLFCISTHWEDIDCFYPLQRPEQTLISEIHLLTQMVQCIGLYLHGRILW